jgi:2-(1,2-epoxy-1,2-dihydrophenyl)acetyl-CoA isomerase
MAQIMTSVAGRVATITLNRPEAMNAFSDGMREALFDALQEYAADPDVGCIVITGAGKAFCAGGDIVSMAAMQRDNDTAILNSRMAVAARVITFMRAMPKPVIAAVNGAAAGGGMNLALACDFRLGSDRALFAQSFVKIGLAPDWGGFSFLPRLVGTAKAMELMMTGERIRADEALRLGLLNRLFSADEFAAGVEEFAAGLAAGPAEALAAIKRGVYLGVQSSLDEALEYEAAVQPALFLSGDAREGMQAFIDKRPPVFGR